MITEIKKQWRGTIDLLRLILVLLDHVNFFTLVWVQVTGFHVESKSSLNS